LVLVALSVVEQRYRAVLAVLDGARVSEVAAEVGVSRQSLHSWLARYREAGLAGLVDRPSRPRSSPNQASAVVEALVCELRRAHPKWGALRIVHELMRGPVGGGAVAVARDRAPDPRPPRPGDRALAAAQAVGLCALAAAGGDAAVADRHRLWATDGRCQDG
jgi:Helix-turn-helix domain